MNGLKKSRGAKDGLGFDQIEKKEGYASFSSPIFSEIFSGY